MPAHCSLDIAPVPESVSRSIRTSSARRANRLYPAPASHPARSSRVLIRIGSTEWIRNGSMMVCQRVSMGGTYHSTPNRTLAGGECLEDLLGPAGRGRRVGVHVA